MWHTQDLSGANVLLHEEVEGCARGSSHESLDDAPRDSRWGDFEFRARSFRAKVSDFGLSHNTTSVIPTQLEGTINYAAPELVAGTGHATKVGISPL